MALARKCGRCGKYYDHYPIGNKTQFNSVQRKQYTSDDRFVFHQDKIDLCSDCMAEFDKFMINGGKFNDQT